MHLYNLVAVNYVQLGKVSKSRNTHPAIHTDSAGRADVLLRAHFGDFPLRRDGLNPTAMRI